MHENELVARCQCGTHALTIESETPEELARTRPEFRMVEILWWEYGMPFPGGTWQGLRTRLRHAWRWLMGNPVPVNELVLSREEADRLIESLIHARERVWGEISIDHDGSVIDLESPAVSGSESEESQ